MAGGISGTSDREDFVKKGKQELDLYFSSCVVNTTLVSSWRTLKVASKSYGLGLR